LFGKLYNINMRNRDNIKYKCNRAYKIRKVTTNNKTGDSYAITIPKKMAYVFHNTYFNIIPSGNNIILESGARPV